MVASATVVPTTCPKVERIERSGPVGSLAGPCW
jgi:hypothetical protein